MNERLYFCSDLAMILAARVIAKNLSDYQAELVVVRTTWTPEFITRLFGNIEDVATDLFGKKPKTALFEATSNLENIMAPARKDLSTLKVQIDTDFKKDPQKYKVMLDELGFSAYIKKIQNKNQAALIGLFLVFNRNIDKYRPDMLEKGTPGALIDRLTGYGEVVNTANTIQEQLKISGKNVTTQMVEQLHNLYEQIIDICKIAANHYLGNAPMKQMFTFTKVVSNMGMAQTEKKAKETVKP
jgi:hypothetical protein